MQAVDAHVEYVPAAVGEADGLLHLPVDFDFVESAELSDAMVNVDHKVPHFQRHQLLDGERFLVLAEPFLQAEAVVALEQLVVGVDQNLELLVHKALAQLHRNGLVRHRFFPFLKAVVEDVVQALELGGLAADDHVDVAAFVVRTQVGRDEVKLLVERRLRRHPVLENHAVGPRGAAAKLHHAEWVEQALQGFAREEQFVGRGALHFATQPVVVGTRTLHGFVQSRFATLGVGHPDDGIRREEAEEGFVGVVQPRIAHVGDDGGTRHFGHAQLRGGLKFADGVHLVAKKLEAVRVVKTVREDVDDAAAHAVLPGLVDEIHLLELVRQQHLVEEVHGVGLADGNGEGLVAEFFAGDHLLGQGFGEGDDAQAVASAVDLVQHLGPHGHVRVFDGLLFGVGHAGGTGVKQYGPGVVQHRLQVVHEVRRLLFVVQHKQVVARVGPFVFVA